MKKYTVYRNFSIQVSREVTAENMGEAERKTDDMKLNSFIKTVVGVDLCDWNRLPGTMIAEDEEQ